MLETTDMYYLSVSVIMNLDRVQRSFGSQCHRLPSRCSQGRSHLKVWRAAHLPAHACDYWQVSEVGSLPPGALHRAAHTMAVGTEAERKREMDEKGIVFLSPNIGSDIPSLLLYSV